MTEDRFTDSADEDVDPHDMVGSMVKLSRRLKAEARARRRSRRAVTFAGVVAVLALAAALWGWSSAGDANDAAGDANAAAADAQAAIDANEASTAEARIASCNQFNDQQDRNAQGEKDQLRFVFGRLFTDLDPDRQAELDAFYADYDADVDARYPHRVCTPEGIEAYLSTSTTTTTP